MRRSSFALALVAAAACGGDDDTTPPIDAPVVDAPLVDAVDIDASPVFVPPTRLSETGLYADIGAKTIAADVHEYAPRWQLWSDDAAKRRWIYLPPGSHIDSADMNFWQFPVGTRLWKEFSRGGDRIETRLMQKIGPGATWGDWFFVSFQWDAGETEGTAVPDGVIDDSGTNDIPARSDCRKCHSDTRNPSLVLGFGALQLDYASTTMDLADLVGAGTLTVAPTGAAPYFPLPAGDPVATEAFGYLHANCGGCHNPRSEVRDTVPVILRQDVTQLGSWATTLAYTTSVDVTPSTGSPGATAIVEPGNPAASALYYRLTNTGGQRMPPVGRETVDPTGSEAVRAWIAALAPTP